MNKNITKWLIILVLFLSVAYPLWVWYEDATMEWDKVIMFEIFPAFGILAFVLMWQHIVGAPLKEWLNKYINWKRYGEITTEIVFAAIILHPVLLYVGFAFNGGGKATDYVAPGQEYMIYLGIVGLLTLLSFDVLRKFKGKDVVARNWNKVVIVSTIGFFLIFFHSLGVGGDLKEGMMRYLWIFYGISAAVAAIYYYGFMKRKAKK